VDGWSRFESSPGLGSGSECLMPTYRNCCARRWKSDGLDGQAGSIPADDAQSLWVRGGLVDGVVSATFGSSLGYSGIDRASVVSRRS
jgi:hypothetical protein